MIDHPTTISTNRYTVLGTQPADARPPSNGPRTEREAVELESVDAEKAIIMRAQRGSDEAFTQLVEAYQTPVHNLCCRMLGQREAAEDAAQETFMRAYEHLHRYDVRRPFPTWLLSIAAHFCIDRLRRRRDSGAAIDHGQETGGLQLADPHAASPESEVARDEQRIQIVALLKNLNALDRAVVVMRYWHDCSEAQIAGALDLTVSAVKCRLHRARGTLAGLWLASAPQSPSLRKPIGGAGHSRVSRRSYEKW